MDQKNGNENMKTTENITITSLEEILNKILQDPIDFYEKVSQCLTVDERMFILHNLKNKSCSNCRNGSCRIESNEKVGLDEQGLPQGHSCIGWYNPVLIGKSKILGKYNF